LILLAGILPVCAQNTGTVVRVGWYESTFNHIDRLGRRSGYAYEYQRRIAANTGWTYEYVEGSWVNLFEMLQRGEIDLLSDVSRTPEREGSMLFSENEMGTEDYYILALSKDNKYAAGDFRSLEGKRIGVNKNSLPKKLLREWMNLHRIHCEVAEYDIDQNEYLDLLQKGEIDAIAAVSSFSKSAQDICIPVAHIGSSNIYFAINKNRPDLKNMLDRSMSQIRSHNSYYNRELHEKYFAYTNFYRSMPSNEVEWLKKHGTLRIGYRDNYLPFCAQNPETGEVNGLLQDFIEKVSGIFPDVKLHIEAIPYPTINNAIDAVKKGEVDVAFPNGMSVYDAEMAGLLYTDAFVRSAEMAVVRNNDQFDPEGHVRAAINASNPNYLSLLHEQYQDWEIVHFPSTMECLKGVADNKADLLLISNYRIGVLGNAIERNGLKAVATGSIISLNFAVKAGETQLFAIISRLSRMMSNSEIHASLAKHSAVMHETTIEDFVRAHFYPLAITVLVILGLFSFMLYITRRDHRRADAANQAKTRFLFSMSHDIRTPMNAIIGYTNLMSRDITNTELCKDYLQKIRRSSDFLLGLINNVLEMARIESGKTELNEEPRAIGEVLLEVQDLYSDLMEKKGLKMEFIPNVKVKGIYCDAVKLSDIYMNLLSNAYKYTPSGGTVTITSNELPDERPGWVKIQGMVRDTGIGMSEEYLPHIFEDFTREKAYTDNKIKGTGLGMAITKKQVELMGGTITVESELGKGTTFWVTIPHRIAYETGAQSATPEEVDTDSFQGKHILLAEDNELNAEIAIEILKEAGFTIDRAEDGKVCVEMYNEAPAGTYDLILMDVQMPNMNGYEATRYIRNLNDPKKANIPILAMTANAFKKDQEDAKNAGMNGHIAKPIDINLMMTTIAQSLKP